MPDFMVMMKTCRPPSLLENVIVYKAYSKLWCIFFLHFEKQLLLPQRGGPNMDEDTTY